MPLDQYDPAVVENLINSLKSEIAELRHDVVRLNNLGEAISLIGNLDRRAVVAAGGLLNFGAKGIISGSRGVFLSADPGGVYKWYFGGLQVGTDLVFGTHYFQEGSGTEQITNGNFADGFTGWTQTGTPINAGDGPSEDVITSAEVNSSNYVSKTFTSVAGTFYLISFMLKQLGGTGSEASISGSGLDSTYFSSPTVIDKIQSGLWTRILMIVKASGTSVTLDFKNAGGADNVRFTEISIKDVIGGWSGFSDSLDATAVNRITSQGRIILETLADPSDVGDPGGIEVRSWLRAKELSLTPQAATPYVPFYPKTDHKWYWNDFEGRERAISERGWIPYAYPLNFVSSSAFTTALALAANGGSIAVPIWVDGHMLVHSVSVRNVDATLARTWGWDIYEQGLGSENVLTRIIASNGNETFTAAAASTRTLNAAGAAPYLGPGLYWLVVQCRHASNTFGLGTTASSAAFAPNTAQTKTTTNPNGSTLDFIAATWTKRTDIHAVRINGKAFGSASAF